MPALPQNYQGLFRRKHTDKGRAMHLYVFLKKTRGGLSPHLLCYLHSFIHAALSSNVHFDSDYN